MEHYPRLEGEQMSELVSGTQAIDRASALLIHILESSTPPLLSQLSRTHEIPKSTTSRILSALERQGLIRRDRDGAYIPGGVLTQFARSQNHDSVLVARMHSVLEKLALTMLNNILEVLFGIISRFIFDKSINFGNSISRN